MNKILNVYRTFYPDLPGGLQEAIKQICISTSKVGIESTVFTLSKNPKPNVINIYGTRVVRSKSWIAPASCDIGDYSTFFQFSKLLKEVDIVQYHFPWPFADALHIITKPKIPSLITYHSDIVRQKNLGALYAPVMNYMLKSMHLVVATSPAYVETSPILSQKSIRDKVRVIPLGINESSYPKIGDDSIFDRINCSNIEPYFLFLGVLRYYKGLHTLIEAAKDLKAKIVIAGSGPEGDNLKKQVVELGLDNVIFAGQVSDEEKVSLIKHCTALVLPSHLRSEAFGMVLVEASMFGKPMISCEIGTGTSYVNLHGETGLVVKPASSYELHNAMRDMLYDQRVVEKFGKNARARYELLFSGEALGRAYKAVYDELLS